MPGNQTSSCLNRARELSEQADRVMADFHVALRCRCCPQDGGSLFGGLGLGRDGGEHKGIEGDGSDAFPARRALQRSDFIGLLGDHDLAA
jgi:hypothetical protein